MRNVSGTVRNTLCVLTSSTILTVALPVALPAQEPCCRDAGLEVAERYRVAGLEDRRFTHERYWSLLAPTLESDRMEVTRLGTSVEGRELRAVTAGSGPVTVLLWSQMHGDESTATMALADLIHWLAAAPDEDRLRHTLTERLTLVMLPMLNPDGAERFLRENAVGVDVNRDARRTATPEGRILRSVRDSIEADFGFNLHDQGTRTAGEGGELVAVALLAPAAEEARAWGPVRQRARQVAAVIADVLTQDLSGRLARYDDAFTPRAFGDNMQAWGTSTVLIESGILAGDPQKQELRRLHVVALLSALHSIATGSYEAASTAPYDELPMNQSIGDHLLIFGGEIVLGGAAPVRADIAVRFDDPVARTGPRYAEVGDLAEVVALDTLDARGLFLHATPGADGILRRGEPATLTARRDTGPHGEAVWTLGGEGLMSRSGPGAGP